MYLVYLALWIVFNGRFTWEIVAFGAVISAAVVTPEQTRSNSSSGLFPAGVTAPIPVITTRMIIPPNITQNATESDRIVNTTLRRAKNYNDIAPSTVSVSPVI